MRTVGQCSTGMASFLVQVIVMVVALLVVVAQAYKLIQAGIGCGSKLNTLCHSEVASREGFAPYSKHIA